ncbi:MAG: hypothetical protein Q8R28_04130 [Dehalococcoidia bacterium]|nr:hypothetical protein [Dehalococcoidia bacterium]
MANTERRYPLSILTTPVLPPGQYGWLWDARSRTPDEWVSLARACGLRGILAKYNDGAAVVAGDGSGQRWAEEFRKLVDPCAAAGLLLIPWGYTYPDDYQPAATRIVAQAVAESLPANGGAFYIFHPEIEWDRDPQAADKARQLFGALKQMAPGARWLYSSWGWVDQHPKFPWVVWQHNCQGFLPQAYPNTLGIPDPDLVWNRAYGGPSFGGPQSAAWTGPQGFSDLAARKPIIPTFDIYGGVIPRLAELARNWGAPAISWWVMDNFGEETVAELAANPYASKPTAQDVAGEVSEVVGLRLALDRERARADALQRRIDRALAVLKGGE